jgi:hypothetical protein
MSRKLLAFCLRLVCIEFVYILFSHSPFEQVCKRFPDAETVTFCDIRRRSHRVPPTMNSARAGYIKSLDQNELGFSHEQRARRLHRSSTPPGHLPPPCALLVA